MWRLTFPFVRQAVRERRYWLPLVAVGGFVAGVVATSRSYLESRLLDHASRLMSDPDGGRFLDAPIPAGTIAGGDAVTTLAGRILSDRSPVAVIVAYVAVTGVGVGLGVLT